MRQARKADPSSPQEILREEVRATTLQLRPRYLASRNRLQRLERSGHLGLAALAGLAVIFWLSIFTLFDRVLGFLLQIEEIGPLLTHKLLGMILVGFFSILLFSNLVSALSSFYLSTDLDRLRGAPVSSGSFFLARFAETAAESSWMVLMFAVPAFLAFGIAHEAALTYYLLVIATLPPFVVIPAAMGVSLATVLVTVLPARRTREILVLLAIVAVAVVYLLVRVLRPEQLLSPEGADDFAQFLTGIRAPASVYLPSTWATEVLHPAIGHAPSTVVYYWSLIMLTAVLATGACESIVRRLHLTGWSKAQEGRRPGGPRVGRWERIVNRLLVPFEVPTRLLVVKELKLFARDSSQWSQLILLLSLAVVYVYNFSVLPLAGGPLVTFYFRNAIAFMNLALAAFVTAAVAVRFVFPSISLEGRAFWVIKTAPVDMRRVWWAKFWVAALPLLTLGLALVLITNRFLGVLPLMQWLAGFTMLGLVIAIVALGLWLGAAYPRFNVENAAKISAGAGGMLFMITCMLLIGGVVVLEAWPVYAWFSYRLEGVPIPVSVQAGIGISLASAAGLCTAVAWGAARFGIDRLRHLQA